MKYFKKGKYKESEIRAEYKRLAKLHHPDTITGSNAEFKEMNKEYKEILSKFKAKAESKGNHEKSNKIDKEMKTISDLIDIYIPEFYQPLAKSVSKNLGNLLINEIKKRI